MLRKSLIMVIQPTWNNYKMQSWLGIISSYYPWCVYYKMYTHSEDAGAGTYKCLSCLWINHLATVQQAPPHLLFCLSQDACGLCSKRDSALSSRQIQCASLSQPGNMGKSLDSWKMQSCITTLTRKIGSLSHTECSKIQAGIALPSSIFVWVNFATSSEKDLRGTCHRRRGLGSRFWKGDFYTCSPPAVLEMPTGIIYLPGNPDYRCLSQTSSRITEKPAG